MSKWTEVEEWQEWCLENKLDVFEGVTSLS